ncbi:hypothetical protein VTP01DRAFT_7101 [Rhizomucor pusillus]|uniref:uncharacterized protein n=1 Tax=Rhizomucor pusillus TaxID=4840 RepID=UPI00374486AE
MGHSYDLPEALITSLHCALTNVQITDNHNLRNSRALPELNWARDLERLARKLDCMQQQPEDRDLERLASLNHTSQVQQSSADVRVEAHGITHAASRSPGPGAIHPLLATEAPHRPGMKQLLNGAAQ